MAAIRVAGGVPLLEAADDPAAVEHDGAVADAGDLLDVGGKDEHGEAAVGERAELEVDLVARADIDAAGRLLEDEELDAVDQPARDADLLLVAARQRPHPCSGPRVRMPRSSIQRFACSVSAALDTNRPLGRSAPGTGATMFSRTVRSPMMPSRLRSAATKPMPRALPARADCGR